MDDNTITALAREYAEETTKTMTSDPNLTDSDINGIKRDVSEWAEEILRFLLRRYCLVEKRRVIAELNAVDLSIKASMTFILKVTEVDMAKKELLHSLFPEIAKEVEG